ncbi:hypothetical protein [Neorhodopirellula pilleata]|uniref:Uncharacterized protein n=1 Tax=Neorhodopirellula pilleata TaxID=2714738 RepID=A0A5C6A6C3_9BACT|nr:hypothetical protein [Neorhodopirellula pilleata]TWT95069.1 hypothetical protein Pla100_36500 [Neorhodopirellula pilleata]
MKVSNSMTEPSSQTIRSQTKRRSTTSIACQMVLGLALMLTVTTSVGCFLPIYSARPERRVQQLLFTSDNLRQIVDDWERFWQLDSPSHMSPIRTHGGIL